MHPHDSTAARNTYKLEWAKAHPDRVNAARQRWNDHNPAKYAAQQQANAARRTDKLRNDPAYQECVRERRREHAARKRMEDPGWQKRKNAQSRASHQKRFLTEPEYRGQLRERNRAASRRLREAMIAAYGGRCNCCGESHYEFLALDHIDGGGNQLRKANRSEARTETLIRRLRAAGWPHDKYRLLCHNCNMARGSHGYCPHQASPI